MPLGALITQRWVTVAAPAEARPQPVVLAVVAPILPVDAVQQGVPNVADNRDGRAEGTAALDAASPADAAARLADVGPSAAQADGSPRPAQGLASAPASPVGNAGRDRAPVTDDRVTSQPCPDSRAVSPVKPADQPAVAAAAASSLVDRAPLEPAADISVPQPAATEVPATIVVSEGGEVRLADHACQQQPRRGGSEPPIPASSLSLKDMAVEVVASADMAPTARGSADSQLPQDAIRAAVMPKGTGVNVPASQQSASTSPSEDRAVAVPAAVSPGFVRNAATAPCAVSPALLITTQDWHRLLGAEAYDAVPSPDFAGRTDILLRGVDDALDDSDQQLSPRQTERPAQGLQDIVPDSDTSIS